jgi:hypothetical protein
MVFGASRLLVGLTQRILIGFVQALDVVAVEALVIDLQPSPETACCAQVFDGISDGLGRRRETAVLGTAVFWKLRQEQFGWGVVVERHRGRLIVFEVA